MSANLLRHEETINRQHFSCFYAFLRSRKMPCYIALSTQSHHNYMASINTSSVREELERLKSEFKRPSSEQSISGEITLLMSGMLTLLELICAIFLEKSTTKNSQNSSKPSSQTDKDETALGQPGAKAKGKTERRQSAYNTRTIETTTVATVSNCDICGEDLTGTACHRHERRTKIDVIFEKTVEHVDAQVKDCRACGAEVKAKFPSDMPGPLQYGNGLKAYVINLLVCQMVALNRVQKSVSAMIGQVISEVTLLKYVL